MRTLVAHEDSDYEEWGASGAIRVSPNASGRGLTLSIAPAYRATGGKTVFVDVRIQRLKLDAGKHWRNAHYTIRLTARSEHAMVEGSEVGGYVEDAKGEMRFGTDGSGSADWITFVERDDRDEDSERVHRFGPELSFTDDELRVRGPQDEFDLTLILRNETNGRTLELPGAPRTDTGTDMDPGAPPVPETLGLLDVLNPAQEGGLFDVVGRGWKYRKCIEERRAAKRFLGAYTTAAQAGENSVSASSSIAHTREERTTGPRRSTAEAASCYSVA